MSVSYNIKRVLFCQDPYLLLITNSYYNVLKCTLLRLRGKAGRLACPDFSHHSEACHIATLLKGFASNAVSVFNKWSLISFDFSDKKIMGLSGP